MKSHFHHLVIVCFAVAVLGCGGTENNNLADEGVTGDDIAQYEADLAAVTAEEDHPEDDEGSDDE